MPVFLGIKRVLNKYLLGIACGFMIAMLVEIFDMKVIGIQATKVQLYIHTILLWIIYSPIIIISFLSPKPYVERIDVLKSISIGLITASLLILFSGNYRFGTSLVMTLLLILSGIFWNWFKQKQLS